MKYFLIFFPTILLMACTFPGGNTGDHVLTGSLGKPIVYEELTLVSGEERIYTPVINTDGEGALRVGYATGAHLILQFATPGRQSIELHMLAGSGNSLNVRPNQIIYPSGMRDGPFDREMFYTFTESGVYQIVFGANLMAEGPLSGTVDMTMLLN